MVGFLVGFLVGFRVGFRVAFWIMDFPNLVYASSVLAIVSLFFPLAGSELFVPSRFRAQDRPKSLCSSFKASRKSDREPDPLGTNESGRTSARLGSVETPIDVPSHGNPWGRPVLDDPPFPCMDP